MANAEKPVGITSLSRLDQPLSQVRQRVRKDHRIFDRIAQEGFPFPLDGQGASAVRDVQESLD